MLLGALHPHRDRGLATLVPCARRGDRVDRALRRRRSALLVPSASAEALLTWEALHALPDGDAGRVLDALSSAARTDVPSPLVEGGGCGVRGGAGATRDLLTWLRPSSHELAALEAGLYRDAPAAALGLLLRPPTVWTDAEAEALAATVVAPWPPGPGALWSLERTGIALVRARHRRLVRAASERLVGRLPEGVPCARATLVAGAAAVGTDRAAADAVAVRLLARLALRTSARARDEMAPPPAQARALESPA